MPSIKFDTGTGLLDPNQGVGGWWVLQLVIWTDDTLDPGEDFRDYPFEVSITPTGVGPMHVADPGEFSPAIVTEGAVTLHDWGPPLTDGTVLVAGGPVTLWFYGVVEGSGTVAATVSSPTDQFDPISGSWTLTAGTPSPTFAARVAGTGGPAGAGTEGYGDAGYGGPYVEVIDPLLFPDTYPLLYDSEDERDAQPGVPSFGFHFAAWMPTAEALGLLDDDWLSWWLVWMPGSPLSATIGEGLSSWLSNGVTRANWEAVQGLPPPDATGGTFGPVVWPGEAGMIEFTPEALASFGGRYDEVFPAPSVGQVGLNLWMQWYDSGGFLDPPFQFDSTFVGSTTATVYFGGLPAPTTGRWVIGRVCV